MSQFILIAGPQAAGKSTAIGSLKTEYEKGRLRLPRRKTSGFFTLQETRQIIAHKYRLLGAIFMTQAHELEVVESDLCRMNIILHNDRSNSVYVDECNIFTIAHAAAHGITGVEKFWDQYIERLTKLNGKVIFLDAPPEVSWERRRKTYEQRLVHFPESEHREIMERYRAYLEKLSHLLKDVYNRLPLQKQTVNACLPVQEVSQKIAEIVTNWPALK